MKRILMSLLLGSCIFPTVQAQENHVSKVWVADQGDGTYKNPVLYADYSDPDVIRVGEDYYLTSSSFGCLQLEFCRCGSASCPTPCHRYSSSARQSHLGSLHPLS